MQLARNIDGGLQSLGNKYEFYFLSGESYFGQQVVPIVIIRTAKSEDASSLAQLAKSLDANLEIQISNLPSALVQADVAIASTGTVTMECAFFGVPTVTLYKTSRFTYEIAKRIVTVKSLTMPNILAGEEIYPEFVQGDATPENISRAALELLQDESRRTKIKSQLAKIISSLGEPGAAKRSAAAIFNLFNEQIE